MARAAKTSSKKDPVRPLEVIASVWGLIVMLGAPGLTIGLGRPFLPDAVGQAAIAATAIVGAGVIVWLIGKAAFGGPKTVKTFTDGMDGSAYEAYCAWLLRKAGWKVHNKGDSADQGIDLIARRRGVTVAIQCKRYGSNVGNKAVQEIIAGRPLVAPAARAAVVTNADYTRSAKELAEAHNVLLLHHDDLACLDDYVTGRKDKAA